MRTLLSFLVALLAVASPSLAQTFRAASSNATYIAYRTDGRTGTGTFTDPYNGSTAARLDTLLSNAPAGEIIYFMPSLDYQSKPVLSDGNPSWRPKSGQSYIGIGGMDKVRISMATNTPIPSGGAAIFNADTTSPVTNVLIKDIWLENNHSRYLASSTISNAASAISMFGSDITVDGVRSTGAWGDRNGKEGFPIFLSIYGFTNQSFFGAMTVRNSEVIHTNNTPWNYVSGITINSAVTAQDSNAAPENFNQTKIGIAENNTIVSTTVDMQTAFSLSPMARYVNNKVYGVRFGYIDTAKIRDIEVVDNYVYGGPHANVIVFSITTNGPLSSAQAGNIRLVGNTFVTRTNASNGGNANGQLYFASGNGADAGAWGNQTNTATGEIQWIGYTNIYIANNNFLSVDPSTGFDAGNPAIGGQFDGLQVIDNTFSGVQNALLIAGSSSNILFSGNTVLGGDIAIRHTTENSASQNSRRLKVIDNVFKEQKRAAYYGGAHDLELVGNTFVDFQRGLTNLNTAVPALNIGTNYLTAAQQNPTNVTVAHNRFLLTYKDIQYPIVASNVVGLEYYGNISEATGVPQIFSSTMAGPSFQSAIYITNSGGLAAIYTNGVLFQAVGGSESTAPGTNLVMAGTTLSLSNSIINDVAKWRSNSAYTGGTLTAGQWASWASNGVLHLTSAAGGSVVTISGDGTILTNGVAFAGGGGGSVATDAIWDAAGDLAVGTGANTAARLAVGTAGQVLTANGTTAVWSNAVVGGGGNVSATNNGASGEIAIYGGSARMISFTNTITANVSLAGAQTNAPLAFGQDGYATNGGFIADQFGTNLATATAGPSYYIKSGALVTNLVLNGSTNTIANGAVLTNAGWIVSPSQSRPFYTINGVTNSGYGFNAGNWAIFMSGSIGIQGFVSGNQRAVLFGGNADNSGSYIGLSDFGPRITEMQRQGLLSITNASTAGQPVTNRTYGATDYPAYSNLASPPTGFARYATTNANGRVAPLIITDAGDRVAFAGTTNTAGAATGDYLILYVNGTRVKVAILAD